MNPTYSSDIRIQSGPRGAPLFQRGQVRRVGVVGTRSAAGLVAGSGEGQGHGV